MVLLSPMNIHQHPIKYPFNPIEYHMKSQPKSNKIQQNLKKKHGTLINY